MNDTETEFKPANERLDYWTSDDPKWKRPPATTDLSSNQPLQDAFARLHESDDYKSFMTMPTEDGKVSAKARGFWACSFDIQQFKTDVEAALGVQRATSPTTNPPDASATRG
jgi:hypothetical protein